MTTTNNTADLATLNAAKRAAAKVMGSSDVHSAEYKAAQAEWTRLVDAIEAIRPPVTVERTWRAGATGNDTLTEYGRKVVAEMKRAARAARC